MVEYSLPIKCLFELRKCGGNSLNNSGWEVCLTGLAPLQYVFYHGDTPEEAIENFATAFSGNMFIDEPRRA